MPELPSDSAIFPRKPDETGHYSRMRRIIGKIIGIICVVLLVLCLVVVIYDLLVPWPVADRALVKCGRRLQLCTGMNWSVSANYAVVPAGGYTGRVTIKSSKQRTYVVIRAPISWPRWFAVEQDREGRVTVNESTFEFWKWFVISIAILWGAWRLVLRDLFAT